MFVFKSCIDLYENLRFVCYLSCRSLAGHKNLWNCGFMAGTAATKHSDGPERLGEAGLALHYANIISQINMIVCIMMINF